MHDIECGFHPGFTNKGTIFFHGEFIHFNDNFDVVVGNYTCKLNYFSDYELRIKCVPNVSMLPDLEIIIRGNASYSRLKNCLMLDFALKKTKIIEYHMLDCLPEIIEISLEHKNSEELRFQYMINEGIDISGIEFMSYEEFIQKLFIEAVNATSL